MPAHRRPTPWREQLAITGRQFAGLWAKPKLRKSLVFGGIVSVVMVMWSPWAGAAPSATGSPGCGAAHLIVDFAPDGTYTSSCGPTPSSTSTPLPTSSSPTSSPSSTPTVGPTTTTATTSPTTPPAPTTTQPVATTLPATTPPATSPAPSPSPTSTGGSGCPVAGKNVAGAADPWGGCWPGPGNTGVPSWVTLTNYTGPCTITVANTIIESKHVTCATLSIRASGVILSDSWFDGTDIENGMRPQDNVSTPVHNTFTIHDSLVTNGARDQCACVGYHDFTMSHVEIRGGNRSMYCEERCDISNSWTHGQLLQGDQHASGLREEQYTQATHNVIVCDWPFPGRDGPSEGCSGGMTGYADFAAIHNNTIHRNLFLGSDTESYCAYGGASGPKPYSSDPVNATFQVFTENVFQYGVSKHCGAYAPVGDFALGNTGNQFTGNVWEDGKPVLNSQLG